MGGLDGEYQRFLDSQYRINLSHGQYQYWLKWYAEDMRAANETQRATLLRVQESDPYRNMAATARAGLDIAMPTMDFAGLFDDDRRAPQDNVVAEEVSQHVEQSRVGRNLIGERIDGGERFAPDGTLLRRTGKMAGKEMGAFRR